MYCISGGNFLPVATEIRPKNNSSLVTYVLKCDRNRGAQKKLVITNEVNNFHSLLSGAITLNMPWCLVLHQEPMHYSGCTLVYE